MLYLEIYWSLFSTLFHYVEGPAKVSAAGSSDFGASFSWSLPGCQLLSHRVCSAFSLCHLFVLSTNCLSSYKVFFFLFSFFLNDLKNLFLNELITIAEGNTEVLWYRWEFKYVQKCWDYGLLVTFLRPWIPFPINN